ncbi:MAG: AzlC family ABC transporter permease [Ruminococcaceae bacterium]|jgi:predicted branched-subunit amino acid permease|nr:AzlC family ABC transporter permease [Oscillospiraceae bacterium]
MDERDQLRRDILRGARDGFPIGLGYFAVAFSLGITAKASGLSPLQGFLASFLNHASAGEYALYSLIAANAAYWEVAIVICIANARYLLMSAALSQRFAPETSMLHRLLVGFGITDEIFGLGVARPGWISPYYMYSAFLVAELCWSSGTACGIVAGNILPASVVSALSVAIYGMFLAIIIPPARQDRVVAGLVLASFACSFAFSVLPAVSGLSSGMKTIVLTVVISALGAALFPVSEEGGEAA